MSKNFMSIAEGQKDDVMSMLSSAFQDKITRNMSILHSILKTIYLCGKQNILLRGHTEEKSNLLTTGPKLIKFWLLIGKTVPQMQGIYHPPCKMNWLLFVVDSYNKLLFQSVIQLIASV